MKLRMRCADILGIPIENESVPAANMPNSKEIMRVMSKSNRQKII